jgi:hypothetical protein
MANVCSLQHAELQGTVATVPYESLAVHLFFEMFFEQPAQS